jgi:hypothetical protein
MADQVSSYLRNAAGAEWGFRGRQELTEHGADVIIRHPMELLELNLFCTSKYPPDTLINVPDGYTY